jgi:hypothetical protein
VSGAFATSGFDAAAFEPTAFSFGVVIPPPEPPTPGGGFSGGSGGSPHWKYGAIDTHYEKPMKFNPPKSNVKNPIGKFK